MDYNNIAGIDKNISQLVQGCIMLNRNSKDEGFALLDADGSGSLDVDDIMGLKSACDALQVQQQACAAV